MKTKMKKINFTDFELVNIVKTLSPRFNVRINKAGNITVSDPNEKARNVHQITAAFLQNYPYSPKEMRGYWTLYADGNGKFLWRRHDGGGYCYPLNMRGRKRIGPIHKEVSSYDGKVYTWYNRESFNINDSYFNTFEEALNYFVKYLKKYKHISL